MEENLCAVCSISWWSTAGSSGLLESCQRCLRLHAGRVPVRVRLQDRITVPTHVKQKKEDSYTVDILTTPFPLLYHSFSLTHFRGKTAPRDSPQLLHPWEIQHTSSYFSLSFSPCHCLCSVSTNYHNKQQDSCELQINPSCDADDVCMDQNTFTVHCKWSHAKCIGIDADVWCSIYQCTVETGEESHSSPCQ